HWTRPELVVEVAFTEWTADGKMRHPKYLGLRDDIDARDVRREPVITVRPPRGIASRSRTAGRDRASDVAAWPPASGATGRLIARLAEIETWGAEAIVELPGGGTLAVSHLDKRYWPGVGLTKGTLLRYYAWAAPLLLPAVVDRPLVMRRFPDGVLGKAFYQQLTAADAPPGGRVDRLPLETEVASLLIGASRITLLYLA